MYVGGVRVITRNRVITRTSEPGAFGRTPCSSCKGQGPAIARTRDGRALEWSWQIRAHWRPHRLLARPAAAPSASSRARTEVFCWSPVL